MEVVVGEMVGEAEIESWFFLKPCWPGWSYCGERGSKGKWMLPKSKLVILQGTAMGCCRDDITQTIENENQLEAGRELHCHCSSFTMCTWSTAWFKLPSFSTELKCPNCRKPLKYWWHVQQNTSKMPDTSQYLVCSCQYLLFLACLLCFCQCE